MRSKTYHLLRRGSVPVLVVAMGLSLLHAGLTLYPLFFPKSQAVTLRDLRVMLGHLQGLRESGTLYDTTEQDFGPFTTAVFKYPPPHAALLSLLVSDDIVARPGGPKRLVAGARGLFIFYTACILGAFGLILTLGTSPRRAALGTAVYFSWQPHWESFPGPQIEPLLLLCITASIAGLYREKMFLAGVPLGFAGGFKVYPWALGIKDLVTRKWRFLAGMACGAAGALALGALAVSPMATLRYFARVLPNLGGVSLSFENTSALGNLARTSHMAHGTLPGTGDLEVSYLALFEPSEPAGVYVSTWLAYLGLAGLLLVATARRVRRARGASPRHTEVLKACVAIPLLLILVPTCWTNYHSLLALPLLVALMWARPPNRDPITWTLIAYATIVGMIPVTSANLGPMIFRSLVPVAIWGAVLRLFGETRPWTPDRYSGSPSIMSAARRPISTA